MVVLKLGDEVRAGENREHHQRPLQETRGKQDHEAKLKLESIIAFNHKEPSLNYDVLQRAHVLGRNLF